MCSLHVSSVSPSIISGTLTTSSFFNFLALNSGVFVARLIFTAGAMDFDLLLFFKWFFIACFHEP